MIFTKDFEIKLLLANRTKHTKGIDMTENLMPLSYQRNPNLENCKVFIQTHKEAQEISKHFAQIQAELITTLEAILQIVELKNQKTLSEKDILEYFKSNLKIVRDFKEILEIDLQDLKRERPNIIESWKYYQELIRICEELDREQVS